MNSTLKQVVGILAAAAVAPLVMLALYPEGSMAGRVAGAIAAGAITWYYWRRRKESQSS